MKVKSKKEIEAILPYPLGKTLEDIQNEYQPKLIRKMSDNENVYGFSKLVETELQNSLQSLFLYPDGTTDGLREQLSSVHGISKDHFLISNGSEELIRLLTRAFISKGDQAILADVTFPIYRSNVIIEGGSPVIVPLINGTHDLKGMVEAITEQTKVVFVCNPNNPTGTCVDPEELIHFIKSVPEHILVVLDEAYDEYMLENQKILSTDLLLQHSNLVILRTFSKIYGLAALRVGYGMMSPLLLEQLVKVKEVFNVNHLAQKAAVVALKDQSFVKDCAAKNLEERQYLMEQLAKLNVSFFNSQTNFLFIYNLGDITPLNEALLRKGLVVRFFPIPQFNGCMRVTLGTRQDQEDLIEILASFYSMKEVIEHASPTRLT